MTGIGSFLLVLKIEKTLINQIIAKYIIENGNSKIDWKDNFL
tara:strand:- start:423 stop:548 length:126 start_codon:yes stop_codon:yes gene_type:complete